MRYVFLIYDEERTWADGGQDIAPDSAPAARRTFHAEAKRAGVYVAGEAFQPTFTATTLTAAGGGRQLIDSPAGQTPLALSGFYVLDVVDDIEALRWASRIPAAASGAIEVRRAAIRR